MGQYYMPCIRKKGRKTWKSYCAHDFGEGLKLTEHYYVKNPLTMHIELLLLHNPMQLVWAGDYAQPEQGKEDNLYSLAKQQKPETLLSELPGHMYLVNHTKKQYVDYKKLKKDKYGDTIDPMVLLCEEGNGQGGGDYYGKDEEHLGIWARDVISIENKQPDGFELLVTNFAYCDE